MVEAFMARFEGVRRLAAVAGLLSLLVACGGPDGPTPPTALAVSSVAPNTAITSVAVTIYGSGFRAGATVTFGGVIAEVVSISSSWIIAITPELPPGRVDVLVTNTNGESATLVGALTLVPFAVTGTFPNKGSADYTFTILGTGLIDKTTVKFGGVPATVAFGGGPFGISGLLPPHAPGPVDITVTHPLGRSLTIPNALTYVPPPVLTASPVTVTVGGSVTLSWVAEVTSSIDYISLFPEAAAKHEHWLEIASQRVTGTSGSMTFTVPSSPGRYEFRYLPFEGQWDAVAARSNVVTVTPASPTHAYDIAAMLRGDRRHQASMPARVSR